MKRATPNFFSTEEDNFDKGIGRWIIVNSRDDLFRIGINIDFSKLRYRPLFFSIDSNNCADSYDEA